MIINNNSPAKSVTGLNDQEIQAIKNYLKERVNDWIKKNPSEPFTLSDLVGKENANWEGTPLQRLYDKNSHFNDEKKQYAQTAKDAGLLLKKVLEEDLRTFSLEKKRTNTYIFI